MRIFSEIAVRAQAWSRTTARSSVRRRLPASGVRRHSRPIRYPNEGIIREEEKERIQSTSLPMSVSFSSSVVLTLHRGGRRHRLWREVGEKTTSFREIISFSYVIRRPSLCRVRSTCADPRPIISRVTNVASATPILWKPGFIYSCFISACYNLIFSSENCRHVMIESRTCPSLSESRNFEG